MRKNTIVHIENICYEGNYKIDRCFDKENISIVYELVLITDEIDLELFVIDIHMGYFKTEQDARKKLKRLVKPSILIRFLNWLYNIALAVIKSLKP